MPTTSDTQEYLPLSAMDFHVLMTLTDGPLHGYGVMKAIERASDGRMCPEIGSLYRMIGRLMTDGMIEEAPPPRVRDGDGRGRTRRYYRITDFGRAVGAAEAARLERVLVQARASRFSTARRGS